MRLSPWRIRINKIKPMKNRNEWDQAYEEQEWMRLSLWRIGMNEIKPMKNRNEWD